MIVMQKDYRPGSGTDDDLFVDDTRLIAECDLVAPVQISLRDLVLFRFHRRCRKELGGGACFRVR